MSRIPENPEREDRIVMEVVVDAYDDTERALGWYYYVQRKLNCPFKAQWISNRGTYLEKEEDAEVIGMASEDECEEEGEILVEIRWEGEEIIVPLAEIDCVEADERTQEAVEDWCYWVAREYEY